MNYSVVREAGLEETLERPGPADGVVERRGPARLYGLFVAAALAVLLFLISANPAWAAEFTVTRSDDPTPGACEAGDCSLREAVIAANTNGEADTINLPPASVLPPNTDGYTLTIGGRNEEAARRGDLDITSNVDIVGTTSANFPVVNVQSANIDRIFDIKSGVTANISQLVISGGDAQQVGGGIRNSGTLTLTGSVVRDNTTGSTGDIDQRRGGGIYNLASGDLTLLRTTVRNNVSRGDGGGIYNFGGNATLTASTVDSNRASDDGGGISNRNGGTLTLIRSTVSNNQSADEGGGIRVRDQTAPFTQTTLNATNSTISGNRAGDQGGGVFGGPNSVVTFTGVTINGNEAPNDASNVFSTGQAIFDKTIVANGSSVPNCNQAFTSEGNNLEDDGSCGFNQPSDVNNVAPLLGPLQDNGGFTQTHALQDGSPAIDGVEAGECAPLTQDQRTIDRPQDGDANVNGTQPLCDIGAYEVEDDNEPPVANDDAAATLEDTAVTIEVLANDQDPNGDPLTVTVLAPPTSGTAEVNPDGSITYTPNPGFTGDDTFTYQIDDGRGGLDTATVDVTVAPGNEPPEARDDRATTVENRSVRIAVLRNDSDPDNDRLTVQSFTQPDNGRVSRNSNGTLTYTPDRGFSERDSFTYVVSDGDGGTDTATVRINIQPAAVPPRADLSVKVNAPNKVRVGDTFPYTVTVSNRGPSTARNVILRSKLPRSVEFVRAPKGCFYNRGNRTVVCKLGNIADDAKKQRRIVVKAVKPGTARLRGCYVKSNTNDPNRSNNNTSG